MDQKLSTDVIEVLRNADIDGCVLRLPDVQLERKLYERVNKALANAGGKWKKGTGHVFSSEVAPKLAAMLGSGISVDEKKRDQAFYTPPELAQELVSMAELYEGCEVLEPSCGMGILADLCANEGANVDCYDINPECVKALEPRYAFGAQCTDFLSLIPDEKWMRTINGVETLPYDRVVMNPPFSKNQDIKHVNHALRFLRPGGVLVAIMYANQERKGFQELVAKYDPEITEVERGAFKDSGTDIATIIVKIRK